MERQAMGMHEFYGCSLPSSEAVDDKSREFFACPFCYEDVEVSVLSSHLREEHCFDVKNEVCPLCAGNLGNDVLGHFTAQHLHMFKRKPLRTSLWCGSSAAIGKEPHGGSLFPRANSTRKKGHSHNDSVPDPLLTPFIRTLPSDSFLDGDTNADTDLRSSVSLNMQSLGSSACEKTPEQDYDEKTRRVEFFQQIIMSTIF